MGAAGMEESSRQLLFSALHLIESLKTPTKYPYGKNCHFFGGKKNPKHLVLLVLLPAAVQVKKLHSTAGMLLR